MFSKPLVRKLMKGVIVLELLGVFGAYSLFHMMNSSQEFRSTVNRRFPPVLEVYYQSNEWAGVYGVRERDREAWGPPGLSGAPEPTPAATSSSSQRSSSSS